MQKVKAEAAGGPGGQDREGLSRPLFWNTLRCAAPHLAMCRVSGALPPYLKLLSGPRPSPRGRLLAALWKAEAGRA